MSFFCCLTGGAVKVHPADASYSANLAASGASATRAGTTKTVPATTKTIAATISPTAPTTDPKTSNYKKLTMLDHETLVKILDRFPPFLHPLEIRTLAENDTEEFISTTAAYFVNENGIANPRLRNLLKVIVKTALPTFQIKFAEQLHTKPFEFRASIPEWNDPFSVSFETNFSNGLINSILAIQDCNFRLGNHELAASVTEAFPNNRFPWFTLEQTRKTDADNRPMLGIHITGANEQGTRAYQEDFFFIDSGNGTTDNVTVGIFDGHGGEATAKSAKEIFANGFRDVFALTNQDIYLGLQILFHEAAKETRKNDTGSVAAVAHVDRQNNLLWTAALGDCGVLVFRKIDGKTKFIPASRQIDWCNQSEILRAHQAGLNVFTKEDNYNPSNVKCQLPLQGKMVRQVTNSRAFGDCSYNQGQTPVILPVPSIACLALQPEDTIVVFSDGIKTLSIETMIKIIDSNPKNLSEALTNAATQSKEVAEKGASKEMTASKPQNMQSQTSGTMKAVVTDEIDNTTVIAIKMGKVDPTHKVTTTPKT